MSRDSAPASLIPQSHRVLFPTRPAHLCLRVTVIPTRPPASVSCDRVSHPDRLCLRVTVLGGPAWLGPCGPSAHLPLTGACGDIA